MNEIEPSYLPDITWLTVLLITTILLYALDMRFSWLTERLLRNLDYTNESEGSYDSVEEKNAPMEYDDLLEGDSKIVEPLHDPNTSQVEYSHKSYSDEEMLDRSFEFYNLMKKRRSIRLFSDKLVPQAVIENLIKTAGTSPSGAHTEPWTFVAVKTSDTKVAIREVVEKEEKINYQSRMGDQWKNDLQFAQTHWEKKYLTVSPWLIVVFRQTYFPLPNGKRRIHYYNEISTSLSTGILLAAIQNAGLVTLTSTPLNCGPAIREILKRPIHEKLLLLLPVGYPLEKGTVPDLCRKKLDDILIVA